MRCVETRAHAMYPTASPYSRIPSEIITHMLAHLPRQDIARAAQTCHAMQHATQWRHHHLRISIPREYPPLAHLLHRMHGTSSCELVMGGIITSNNFHSGIEACLQMLQRRQHDMQSNMHIVSVYTRTEGETRGKAAHRDTHTDSTICMETYDAYSHNQRRWAGDTDHR